MRVVKIKRIKKSSKFNVINYIKKASHKNLIVRESLRFRKDLTSALLFTIVAAFLEGLMVGLIASFLQGLTNPDAPPIQTGIEWINSTLLATEADPAERFIRLSALLFLMTWCLSAAKYWGIFSLRVLECRIIDSIRKQLFEQFQNLSLSYYAKTRDTDLIDIATTQTDQLKMIVRDISSLMVRGFTLLAYVATMIVISWQLSIFSISLYGALSVAVTSMVKKAREEGGKVPQEQANLSSVIIELVNGIRTVKASAAQELERDRFYKASESFMDATIVMESYTERTKPFAEGTATTILLVMVVASYFLLITTGRLQAAALLTYMFVLFRMMPLVSQVNGLRSRVESRQGIIARINYFLSTADKPYLSSGNIKFSSLKESIQLSSVSFSYDGGSNILNNISLSFEKGQTTALVGSSGAGKTTLADLVPRFFEPTSGHILVDGVDISEIDITSLRQKMSVVSQDTFIFNRSVRENIAYGLTGVSDSDIKEAAVKANAIDFIMDLPDGLDTVLGNRGVRLSGGQRQRIAIARALLRNPDILILDEATSALDSVSESLIQQSLEDLSKGRTVITIAHRLSTIANAHKVVVLDKGYVVEQGTYDELLQLKGALWKYHNAQFTSSTALL